MFAQAKSGLGTGIVTALAKQLDAKMDTMSDPTGTTVSITHATFAAKETRVEYARVSRSTVRPLGLGRTIEKEHSFDR
jgi:hypothetical protein